MKNIAKFLLLTLAVAGIAMPFACKKNNDNGGDPTISRIRAISPAPNDSVLTKAGPGQTIVIQGSNLSTTSEVYFNGYRSSFNSALLSDQNVVVTIPGDMPFAILDPAKLNTIRIVTQHGEVTYTFPIVPPAPAVETMTNEMAIAGERVIITGANFFFVEKVVFGDNNKEVTTGIVTNNPGTLLEVTVPAGVTPGPIKVVNRYGTGVSYFRFNDDVTGVISNFDGVNPVNNWAGAIITNDATLFPDNKGNYVRLKYDNVAAGDAAWWQGGRSVNIETDPQWVPVANLTDPPANWAVKFEINTRVPWKGGLLLVAKDYSWDYMGRVAPWEQIGGEYKSNGWKTVTIPFSNFKADKGAGAGFTNFNKFFVNDNGANGINLFFVNDQTGATVVEALDVAVDNIRVGRIR